MSFFYPIARPAKPRKPKLLRDRKPLKKVGKKGEFWLFCSKVWTRFFFKLAVPPICQRCEGSAYCGFLQPAHLLRRQDIRVGDWWNALRVVPLGNDCHYAIDVLGRRAAEPILTGLWLAMLKDASVTEDDVKRLLIQCAKEVQQEFADKGRFQEYVVSF